MTLSCVYTCQHVLVGIVRDGEDMRRSFTPLLSSVGHHHLLVVDRQPLVGVDRHTEQPRVRLRESETGEVDEDATFSRFKKYIYFLINEKRSFSRRLT